MWAWGSKRDIVTGTNAIDRSILDGFTGGKSLVVMQIAERFLSYGPLGKAAPGLGCHGAGYYTYMILT